MPIIDIQPVGSKNYDPKPVKFTPVYLIVAEDPTAKSQIQKYVATKLDDLQTSIKFVGFETNAADQKIAQNYQEMINSSDKLLYIEVQVPLQKVVLIRNLTFKHK